MNSAAQQITTISSTDQGFAVATLVLVVFAIGALVGAHLVDRGVDPIAGAVSDFGAREHPWFYRMAAVWTGAAALLVAVIFANAIFPRPTLTIFALLLFAGARGAITIFPTDLEGEEGTPVGRSHVILAVLGFASICVAAASFLLVSGNDPAWAPRWPLGLLVGMICASALWSAAERIRGGRFFGLAERLLYAAIFGWLAAISLYVLGA